MSSPWARVGKVAGIVFGVVLCGLACAELDERRRFDAQVGTLQIAETIPESGATAVDPLARIDLCLSGEADPRALEAFDVTLRSANLIFDAQVSLQLFSWRAPGSRTELAATRWCPGSVLSLTPGSALQPGLTYRVRVEAALLGWAGEALDTEQEGWMEDEEGELRRFLEFRVAGSPADAPPEDIPELALGPTLTELFAPGEIFDPERAACSCHQQPGELAFERLDLTTPEAAYAGLVLRPGLQATDFPMVTPRQPAESYVVHKLMRTAGGEPLHALRGEPMPPDEPIPHADLVRVTHWIHAGALLE